MATPAPAEPPRLRADGAAAVPRRAAPRETARHLDARARAASTGEPLDVAPGPVHDALRLRGRRGADLGLRRRRAGRSIHTVRAVGAVTRGDLRVAAGRRARRARAVRQRVAASRPPPARDVVVVAGGIGLAPLAARRLRGARAAAASTATSRCSTAAGRPADLLYRDELERWRGRFDLQVDVTVDAADERLARQGRRRAQADRRRALRPRRDASRSSAGPRS